MVKHHKRSSDKQTVNSSEKIVDTDQPCDDLDLVDAKARLSAVLQQFYERLNSPLINIVMLFVLIRIIWSFF